MGIHSGRNSTRAIVICMCNLLNFVQKDPSLRYTRSSVHMYLSKSTRLGAIANKQWRIQGGFRRSEPPFQNTKINAKCRF